MLRRPRFLVAFLAAILFVAGCDTVEDGGFALPAESVRLIFNVSGSNLDAGSATRIMSQNAVNVRSVVESHGFAMSDVISVRIASSPSPELEIWQPPATNISHISSAEVRGLTGSTPGNILLAGSGFPGAGNNGVLTIRSADVTSLALSQNGSFSTALDIVPSEQVSDQAHRFEVTFRLIIEVEG